MARINDGGPAFARPASEYTKQGTLPDGNDAIEAQEGMGLRTYLAAKAMQGLLSDGCSDTNYEVVAHNAVCHADALLAELAKAKGETP